MRKITEAESALKMKLLAEKQKNKRRLQANRALLLRCVELQEQIDQLEKKLNYFILK